VGARPPRWFFCCAEWKRVLKWIPVWQIPTPCTTSLGTEKQVIGILAEWNVLTAIAEPVSFCWMTGPISNSRQKEVKISNVKRWQETESRHLTTGNNLRITMQGLYWLVLV